MYFQNRRLQIKDVYFRLFTSNQLWVSFSVSLFSILRKTSMGRIHTHWKRQFQPRLGRLLHAREEIQACGRGSESAITNVKTIDLNIFLLYENSTNIRHKFLNLHRPSLFEVLFVGLISSLLLLICLKPCIMFV